MHQQDTNCYFSESDLTAREEEARDGTTSNVTRVCEILKFAGMPAALTRNFKLQEIKTRVANKKSVCRAFGS
jgi:hypothetical protein